MWSVIIGNGGRERGEVSLLRSGGLLVCSIGAGNRWGRSEVRGQASGHSREPAVVTGFPPAAEFLFGIPARGLILLFSAAVPS